jgi:hypothetical protein
LPREENSRESFVRLAEARTNRVLKDLDLLGNLSNRSNYSYSEEDMKKIFKVIAKRLAEAQDRFRNNLFGKQDPGFRL